ncbi:hypothetical protein SBA1_820005 [Candidatus Sulfotelmatobacter kueseliae]|uniref:Uncharacterized protein n=1 Tax=Candidatus Sulfotelmatobacter kueseliae TaxID=2042962 RepID=A0A2U3L8G0_9BACT|nr:hypothetical protein SBA1_820005 [Candidatus Sulfotelmatobacter kueseliae]
MMHDNPNALTQGDGNTKPDPSIDMNLNPNPTAEVATNGSVDTPDRSDGVPAVQPKPPTSEAKLHANRENAKKSTGPTTARGKYHSRLNAMKHGMLSKPILYHADGTPTNDDFHTLQERLQQKYGTDDIRTQLLTETIVVECWRQRKALDIEAQCFEYPTHFSSTGLMPQLQRYRTASQRALEKSFELLEEQSPSSSAGEEAEGDAPAFQPETVPQAAKPTGGLTVMTGEESAPEQGSESQNEASSGEGSTSTGDVEDAA